MIEIIGLKTFRSLKKSQFISISATMVEKINQWHERSFFSRKSEGINEFVLRIEHSSLCYELVYVSVGEEKIFFNIFDDIVETSIRKGYDLLPRYAGYSKDDIIYPTYGITSSADEVSEKIEEAKIFLEKIKSMAMFGKLKFYPDDRTSFGNADKYVLK